MYLTISTPKIKEKKKITSLRILGALRVVGDAHAVPVHAVPRRHLPERCLGLGGEAGLGAAAGEEEGAVIVEGGVGAAPAEHR